MTLAQEAMLRMRRANARMDKSRRDFVRRIASGPDWEAELAAPAPEAELPTPQPPEDSGPREPRTLRDKLWAWRKRAR